MAKLTLIIFVLSTVFLVGHGRHIHPNNNMRLGEDTVGETQAIATDIDGIEMMNEIQSSRFVPINNVLFFQRYAPCEDGFERDLLGVCREVWE